MDKKFMDIAISQALIAASEGEVPVGAVIVRQCKVLAVGRNRREKEHSATAHAEIEAINSACKKTGNWRLDDCDIYVTLEPCPMCSGAIINSRIKTVVFGAYDTKSGALGSVANFAKIPFSCTPEVYGGIRETECCKLLSEFFQKLRNDKSKKAL